MLGVLSVGVPIGTEFMSPRANDCRNIMLSSALFKDLHVASIRQEGYRVSHVQRVQLNVALRGEDALPGAALGARTGVK